MKFLRQFKRFSIVALGFAILVALAAAGGRPAPLDASVALGLSASDSLRIDTLPVPSGTTILSPSVLSTVASPAVVHLLNGQLVALGSHAQATFSSTGLGGVQIAVHSGVVAVRSQAGELLTLGRGSLLQLDDEGQIGEGTKVQVGMCHLVDWELEKALACLQNPDGEGCEWELIEVDQAEVEERLELGDVVAGDNDIGLDSDCETDVGGLGMMEKVGIGFGSGLLAGLLLSDDDEGEEPATIIEPDDDEDDDG